MARVSVTILETIFRNDLNSYSVINTDNNDKFLTVVGYLPTFKHGESIVFEGNYIEHNIYGTQFEAVSYTINIPNTIEEIESFLASGVIKGIRENTAKLLVDKFGANTLNILDNSPELLYSIKGIGKKRIAMIMESYNEIVGLRKILITLQNYGFSPQLSIKIAKYYNENTLDIIKTNPYRLVDDIDGIGFSTADKIAMKMGFDPESEFRIQSALVYLLYQTSINSGHTYMPKSLLIQNCGKLLSLNAGLIEKELNNVIISTKIKSFLIDESNYGVSLPYFFNAEKEIAIKIKQILKESKNEFIDRNKNISNYFEFNCNQKKAISMAVNENFCIITGGPGTGKTTIINEIINILKDNKIILCAPTGRAAKRMEQATGVEAYTIHRLLEYGFDEESFGKNEFNTLEANYIIVDEFSMVDVSLFNSFLKAVAYGTKIILLGDSDQLPSIGAGNVLSDLLGSEKIPSIYLTDIYRQLSDSLIIENSIKIKKGEYPIFNKINGGFYFEEKINSQDVSNTVVDLISHRLPNYVSINSNNVVDILSNIQVICPTKIGDCGTIELNKRIQQTLNPSSRYKKEVIYANKVFRVGDKVIQTKNDYNLEYVDIITNSKGRGVFNGDIGIIQEIYDSEITIVFDDYKKSTFTGLQIDSIDHAYCITVHKSQGCEFTIVIIPLFNTPLPLVVRNLLYTAITRAKTLVVIIGDRNIIQSMINNNHIAHRFTRLRYYIETLI